MTGLKNSGPNKMMNRVLIVGGTGYIGKYMAKASVSLGYPTYVLVRPATAAAPDSFKEKLLQQFKDIGIHILQVSAYSTIIISFVSCHIWIKIVFIMSRRRRLMDLGFAKQGSLDDHNSLVVAIKQVDIVISAVAIPQHLDQFNLIRAIKEVGIENIKVYTPLLLYFSKINNS